jgi:hypothetical protein
VGRARLGLAVSDLSGSFRALRPAAQAKAQETDRLGAADAVPGATLAAKPHARAGGRQQLCCFGTALGPGTTRCDCDHAFASGCCFVRAASHTSHQEAGAATEERQAAATSRSGASEGEDSLDTSPYRGLVRSAVPRSRGLLGHGPLVLFRHGGADPLGAAARPGEALRSASAVMHRFVADAPADCAVVCAALAGGGHLCRGAGASRRGDALDNVAKRPYRGAAQKGWRLP